MRLFLAFFVAPLASGLILFLASIFTGKPGEGVWAFGLSAMIAYPIVLLIGGPVYLILRKLEWNSLTHYLTVGIILSAVPIFALVIWPKFASSQSARPFEIYDANLVQTAILFIATIATVVTFWFIARPDRVAL